MKLTVRETALFGFFGALMFASKLVMDALPNMHLLALFTVVLTVVYRGKALFPVYICVLLIGLYGGFSAWWLPHMYLWTILWGAVMLLPKRMSVPVATVVYAVVTSAHGFLYGTLYAPAQAVMFGYSLEQTVAWIVAGLPFDVIHGLSNLGFGILAVPMIKVLRRLEKRV